MATIGVALVGAVAGFATLAIVSVSKEINDVKYMNNRLSELEQTCSKLSETIDILESNIERDKTV